MSVAKKPRLIDGAVERTLLAIAVCVAGFLAIAAVKPAVAGALERSHGIAMHGEPALSRTEPLPYTNPEAPQGGRITFGALGAFDNLNPMIPRGSVAPGVRDLLIGNFVYESLLERNRAEPFTLYGLLAEAVTVPADRSRITFHIDPAAHFSDGEPVTAEDVVFSHKLLAEKGWPYARNYYAKVEAVVVDDERTVTFRFPNANDRELPLILGLMPILPAHRTDPETFSRTTLEPPVGTGPYVVADVDPGRGITYERDPNYWGAGHPLNAGRYNAHEVRIDMFRDQNSMFEAFKTGGIDIFMETDAARWARGYGFAAARDGRIRRDDIATATPRGMYAFVFNTRRALFADQRVRQALSLLFDFEWINANLFAGQRRRTDSYFSNSALASTGRAASEGERQLLAPFADVVDEAILAGTWRPPVSDGSGRDRRNIRAALGLLREAGWRIDGTELVDADGAPFRFEILVATRDAERLALAFQRLLRPVGIVADMRYVDNQQYNARMLEFDFDMARVYWPASLSPGNEQTHRWSVAAADIEGSFNYAGTKEPAVDAMIAAMLEAEDRAAFEDAVRALDRVLLSGDYVIPLFHTPVQWIAYHDRLGRPPEQSLSGVEFETWWVKP